MTNPSSSVPVVGAAPAPRRWRQFSLRSLLLLTLLCAVSLISWLRLVEPYRRQAKELNEIAGLKLKVRVKSVPVGADWLESLLGKDSLADVRSISLHNADDAFARRLPAFVNLQELQLNRQNPIFIQELIKKGFVKSQDLQLNGGITDTGLMHLKNLRQLTSLDLNTNQITDGGLVHLRGLTRLAKLDLSNTVVTSAGMEHLKPLSELTSLNLSRTQITDEGVQQLAGLSKLQELFLDGTQISEKSLEYFQQLPELDTLSVQRTQIKLRALAKAIPDLHKRRVHRAIELPVDMAFVNVPLADVFDYLSEVARVNIVLDKRAFDRLGVGTDIPITIQRERLPLNQVLQDVLKPLGLVHVVWEGMIVVKSPSEPHRSPLRVSTRPISPELNDALGEPTVLEFVETPLVQVCKYLSQLHNCRIEVDQAAFGTNEPTVITRNLRGMPLRVALHFMLSDDLTGEIDGDTIWIRPQKTPSEPESAISK